MNEARELYLKSYGAIDKLDHLVKNCKLHYRSWKYWHSAMLHGKAIAIVTAYDIYRECCAGTLDAEWKRTPVSFFRFRERLAWQMVHYTPKDLQYPGDEKFRVSTQKPKTKRTKPTSSTASVSSEYTTATGVDRTSLDGATGRVCGFLDQLLAHEKSMSRINVQKKTHLKCLCCGEQTYYKCTLCPGEPPLHVKKPDGRDNSCFLNYHNTATFGAWRGDWKVKAGNRRKDWKYPTDLELREQARQMKRLHEGILEDIRKRQRVQVSNSNNNEAIDTTPINYNNVV